ncbi:component of the polarisome [Allomyces javanicus]|nr:component of the polarisome [Allomyces javanicus]
MTSPLQVMDGTAPQTAFSSIIIPGFEIAAQYYYALRLFLEQHPDRGQQSITQQRQSARDKLNRLSKQQFQELATDVVDEMVRRLRNNPGEPFLEVRNDFHPKRNQARQKLATLPMNRFKDLAADVFFQLESRYPVLLETANRIEGQLHANALSPRLAPSSPGNSYRMSQTPVGMTTPPSYQPGAPAGGSTLDRLGAPRAANVDPRMSGINFQHLDALMADLDIMLHPGAAGASAPPPLPNGSPVAASNGHGESAEMVRREFETKVLQLTETVRQLEMSLQRAETEKKDLHTRVEALTVANKHLDQAVKVAQERCRQLEVDLNNEQSTTEALQRDVEQWSAKARAFQDENVDLKRRITSDQQRMQDLEDQVRRAMARAATPQMVGTPVSAAAVAPSPALSASATSAAGTRRVPAAVSGGISPDRVTAYQAAVEGLAQARSSENRTAVLMSLKNIVFACKAMTEEVEAFESVPTNLNTPDRERLLTLKSQLTASLTELMGAAKAHATGAAPLDVTSQDLQSAAGKLSVTINGIADVVGVRDASGTGSSSAAPAAPSEAPSSSPAGGNDGTGDTSGSSAAGGGRAHSPMDLDDPDPLSLPDLRAFLETQTNRIVQAIQALLQAMRGASVPDDQFLVTVRSISAIVVPLTGTCRASLGVASTPPQVRDKGNAILVQLADANRELAQLGDALADNGAGNTPPSKQQLASAAYEVAKCTKALLGLVEM